EPIGGFAAIQKNLKYPEKAFENKTEGTVIVKALIDKRGKVKATRIVKSLSPECDKAAVKALKKSRWRPALKNGKPVTASVSIPIVFKLKK
ncbi:MAG TPA: energy transducer TonB, partial [Bacteroidetes bacterium]|nr:energy transducer TonB [Bacteroidota bacterium]